MYSGRHGGLKEPSWPESIAALYIIFLSTKFKSRYYKLIFFLNGLSSSLTHSPFFSKNFLDIQKKMNILDGITIYFPLVFELIKTDNDKKDIRTLLFVILFSLLNDTEKDGVTNDFKKLTNFTNIILFITSYKKFSLYSYLIIFIASLTKYHEEIKLFNTEIKIHSVWHILGAHMFKEIVDSRNKKI